MIVVLGITILVFVAVVRTVMARQHRVLGRALRRLSYVRAERDFLREQVEDLSAEADALRSRIVASMVAEMRAPAHVRRMTEKPN